MFMFETPDLTNEFHPVPKPQKKAKKQPKSIGAGKKTDQWTQARKELKKIFEAWGVTTCEAQLAGCVRNNFLGFAHTERRVNLTEDDVRSPDKVILACQSCHYKLDFEMPKQESKEFMEKIIASRAT